MACHDTHRTRIWALSAFKARVRHVHRVRACAWFGGYLSVGQVEVPMSSGSPWVSLGLGSPRPNGPDTPRQVWGSTLQVSASRVDALPYTLHPTHYPIQCHASEALTLLLDNCSLKGFSIGKNFLAYIAGGLWMVAADSWWPVLSRWFL